MTWATPKTNWTTNDVIATTDMNRIEGNIKDMRIAEGANGRMGIATFSADSSVTINNTSVTANTRIFLTVNSIAGGTPNMLISAITPGASFVISVSGGSSITGTVAYLLFEPQ
jgi:hypothetical protein